MLSSNSLNRPASSFIVTLLKRMYGCGPLGERNSNFLSSMRSSSVYRYEYEPLPCSRQ